MSDVHPSLTEVAKNAEDRKYCEEQIEALVRQWQAEGKNTRPILEALFDVMMLACKDLPDGQKQYRFLKYMRDSIQAGIDIFEVYIQQAKSTEH